MVGERLFGTDGIRGRAGEGWMSPGPASALGRAIGAALSEGFGSEGVGPGAGRVLIGHDGRRSGPALEAALALGLAQCGHAVKSAGLFTTPGLAILVREQRFDLGLMVSASHNPAEDNGIKLFGPTGEKLSDEQELEIERRAHEAPSPVAPLGPIDAGGAGGPARALEDLPLLQPDPLFEETYLDRMLRSADGLKLDGLAIALDCANGGASRIGPRVLGRLGAQVISIASSPDGGNINEGCGSTHPEALQEEVRLHGADLGIALDGDGDRCVFVDEGANLVHGDAVLTMLARNMADRLRGSRIVATVMSNRGLHSALREVEVGVETVGVGDRQVVEALKRDRLLLGGEQSGHIVFGADHGYIGDGLYTALRVLRVMRESGSVLSELAGAFRPFPQVLINVPVSRKPPFEELGTVRRLAEDIGSELGEDGRVLLRYSGTEPLARVMIEGPDEPGIRRQARRLADAIAGEIGA